MRLIDCFDRGFSLSPDRPCLIEGHQTLSYREVWRASNRIANHLSALELEPDAVIAVLSPNHLLVMVAVLGILRSGHVWMPINTRNGRDEIRHALRSHDVGFLIHHSSFNDMLKTLTPELTALRGTRILDGAPHDPASLQPWIDHGDDSEPPLNQGADDLVCIRSTGGTTGPSKGVMLTGRVYATLLANLSGMLPVTRLPVHLAAAPLSHASGTLCFATMLFGGSSVILAKPVPEAILDAIEKHAVTQMFLPPTLLYMLLDSPALHRHRYDSLQYLIYAGAPMSLDRLRQALGVFGPVMAQAFGQAEAPFFCTILTPQEHAADGTAEQARRLASCGRATPFTRVAIMDETGALLPRGVSGEVVVRGDLVMKGYYKNPEATAAVSTFGWHHTGDIGYMDKDGYLYLVDRKRDLIISGGFNIAPSEIEQILWSHEAVADCAVIGVPDAHWGEAIKAIIELKPGHAVSAEELEKICRDRLGSMKTPRSFEFWNSLPRSDIGKVLKREIRDRFWAGKASLI